MDNLKEAQQAIEQLFGDTSVPKEQTVDALKELYDDLELKIEALEIEIEQERASS